MVITWDHVFFRGIFNRLCHFYPFHVTGVFLCLLKTSEKQRLSGVFGGYMNVSGIKWVQGQILFEKGIVSVPLYIKNLKIDIILEHHISLQVQ